ncbi:hypothetical protein L207DRAFT_639814 [Hyaloscypha variabilis F]|uniref:Zn(2)-C6 fungal-type domain-containing protein n=1 Tax=Hyaloscypha variabilis (strain UAMH 11265 / GT02V1 / F) TaxID=1149755 RepID=A0A2J6R3R0_HYAVF|nr:hypothetical protein L207DRAFT_639814 [Hyaloscypha variabilis F]
MAFPTNDKSMMSLEMPESGFTCFATRVDVTPRRRAKFDPQRREKVKGVRRRGACLRCRILKIPCSRDDPCATCMSLALAASSALERKVLRWSDCIRTSLTDVSIFTHTLPPQEGRQEILGQQTVLRSTPVQLGFLDHLTWEIDPFTEECARWISDPDLNNICQVGVMSSLQFQTLIKASVGEAASNDFQSMIYAISLAHTQPKTGAKHMYTALELQGIGSLGGERLLSFLEKRLTAQSLGTLSKNELQVLFLMIVGTILAIGYAQPVTESPPFPPMESDESSLKAPQTLYTAMQHHLCRTLAHYIIYLSSKLGLPIASTKEKFILEFAHSLWNKESQYIETIEGEIHWQTTKIN